MNFRVKSQVVLRANERRAGISDSKGPEYAGSGDDYTADDSDILLNFKRQAKRWDSAPVKVLGVYMGKHLDSIETFVRDYGKPGRTLAQKLVLVNKGEGIVSRLDDARNYIDLLECMLVDEGVHPEKINREAVAQAELLELADKVDWAEPGFTLKREPKPAEVVAVVPDYNHGSPILHRLSDRDKVLGGVNLRLPLCPDFRYQGEGSVCTGAVDGPEGMKCCTPRLPRTEHVGIITPENIKGEIGYLVPRGGLFSFGPLRRWLREGGPLIGYDND